MTLLVGYIFLLTVLFVLPAILFYCAYLSYKEDKDSWLFGVLISIVGLAILMLGVTASLQTIGDWIMNYG